MSREAWAPPGGGTGGGGGQFAPGQAVAPTSTVELSVRCEELADMDVFSKSDPFCVLYMKDGDSWILIDKTETIDNNLNPHFEKKFILQFQFEERQLLRFSVFDSDGPSSNLEDHDFIGMMECSLGEVVSQQGTGKGLKKPLIGEGVRNNKQTIIVTAEELISNREVLKFNLSARGLDRKDWWGWGSSDPFITISRSNEYGQWTVVHRTEVVKKDINPVWKPFSLAVTTLCNADHHRVLRFSVDDWNASGSHNNIGEFETCVADLISGQPEYPLVNKKKKQKKGEKYKHSGMLIMNSCVLELQPTFLDFITGGTELSFTVAIDFTASNGNPNDPKSLHYNDPSGRPNQYITAIRAVGAIVQDYDSDKMFPALGFGARIPPDGRVSHEFFLNLTDNPYCEAVEGILEAYYKSLNAVQLYGPTNFSPVINHVAQFARAFQNDPSNYFVLLIITDGVITDLASTKNAIIRASSLPLSIIIVGVGSEDFSAMDELDSDESLLRNDGHTAERDIVQFVDMQRFVRGSGAHTSWNKEMLAREVLAEIPEQLVGYMKNKGFKPKDSSNPGGVYPRVPPKEYAPQAPAL